MNYNNSYHALQANQKCPLEVSNLHLRCGKRLQPGRKLFTEERGFSFNSYIL